MLQLRLDKHLPWILMATLFCGCQTSVALGEDSSGSSRDPGAASSATGVLPSATLPPPAPVSNPAWENAKYYLLSTWSFRNVLEAGFIAGIPNLTSAPVQPEAPTTINLQTVGT